MKLSGLLILSYKEHPCRPARMFLVVSPKNNFPNTSTPAVCPTRTSSSAPPPTTNGYPALCCGKSPIPSFTLPTPSSLTSPLKNWTKPFPGTKLKRRIWGNSFNAGKINLPRAATRSECGSCEHAENFVCRVKLNFIAPLYTSPIPQTSPLPSQSSQSSLC